MEQSILYVDVENLQGYAKQALVNAIEHWPEEFPKPGIIRLYVKADQTELWRIWASHNIPAVEVHYKGVQHFTYSGSKNSADLALALDALADILKERTQHISIMSDDSDYVSLFAVLKQEMGTDNRNIPFKWFMTDRPDTRSSLLDDFLPSKYIHVVTYSNSVSISEMQNIKVKSPKEIASEEEMMARAIIQKMPVGPFKSSDCKKIILQAFPQNKLGKQDSVSFGTHFSKFIWPVLERYGVQIPNSNKKPRKYEMTEEAKGKLV